MVPQKQNDRTLWDWDIAGRGRHREENITRRDDGKESPITKRLTRNSERNASGTQLGKKKSVKCRKKIFFRA